MQRDILRRIFDWNKSVQAKSFKVYRRLFSPPFAVRTSLAVAHDGDEVKDIPLFVLGPALRRLL